MINPQQLCRHLAEIKQRCSMSYPDMSMQLGVSVATLFRWVKGRSRPRTRLAIRSLETFVNRFRKKNSKKS